MKKVISVLLMLSVSLTAVFAQQRQGRQGQRDDNWRERVRAEKVAFLTSEMELTESEAQVFWPIYNELQQKQREGFDAIRKAYDAMEKGVKEGKTGKEMENLVKAYIDAKEQNDGIETKYLNKLMKALPADKVARYYIAEEKFRHQQIGRLGNGRMPNFRMSEEQKEQIRDKENQLHEQFQDRFGRKKGQKADEAAAPEEA